MSAGPASVPCADEVKPDPKVLPAVKFLYAFTDLVKSPSTSDQCSGFSHLSGIKAGRQAPKANGQLSPLRRVVELSQKGPSDSRVLARRGLATGEIVSSEDIDVARPGVLHRQGPPYAPASIHPRRRLPTFALRWLAAS